jgi:hypothetical protein
MKRGRLDIASPPAEPIVFRNHESLDGLVLLD